MVKPVLRRPFTVAKSAQTLDGKVATGSGRSQWITSSRTRTFARRRRDTFRAIVVGAETVVKDNPRLTGVRRRLVKVIVDSTLRVSLKSKVFKCPELCWLATTRRADRKRVLAFESRGIRVLICPAKDRRVHLPYLFNRLMQEGMDRVLIEGGPTLIGQALRDRLVDRVHIYIAPKIMGQQSGLGSVVGLPDNGISGLCRLKNMRIRRMDPDILVEADVHRNR